MITNNEIREFVDRPTIDAEYSIACVDALGYHTHTLMFINRSGLSLFELENNCNHCVFLVDIDEYYKYAPCRFDNNDFIFVRNPKYVFCQVVSKFNLRSKLQLDFLPSEEERSLRFKYIDSLYCPECIIGHNCEIDRGVIIGGKDFSPVMGSSREELVQFPQLGGVLIEDNVVVKYNSMIGRGTFGFTRVGKSTMIDYGCQIGHNCDIGKSCIIAAGTIIGGSTKIGDYTTIGIGAKIRNGITIGERANIGMGAVVIRDVPSWCTVVGNPARIIGHDSIFNEKGLV